MNVYIMLADAIVVLHLVYVAFVMLGLGAIIFGAVLGWQWVRNFWFRTVHFLMIAVVALEALCGVLCPLTEWEDRLRELAGEPNEPGSFIGRLTHKILFVDAPPEVLATCYCVFVAAVLAALFLVPPHCPWKRPSDK